MQKKHKRYLKINLMTIVFAAVSFSSVTLAWFAYSGLATVKTEVGVKAWSIKMEKDGDPIKNTMTIPLTDIYPGMENAYEKIDIKNEGDSDAQISYRITSVRILDKPADNYKLSNEITTNYIEDRLSHHYPFHLNANLTKGYVIAKGEDSIFELSLSWPLDSGNDANDSIWGNAAYQFQLEENAKKEADANYQKLPSIEIELTITAEQYIEEETTSDPRFNLGDEIIVDVINKRRCTELSSTCLKTYVIDNNSTLSDQTVNLLPDPTETYQSGIYSNYSTKLSDITSSWNVTNRGLNVEDLLKVISTDIVDSVLIRTNISDQIIGNLNYQNRLSTEIAYVKSQNGYYKFKNEKFNFLTSGACYWLNSEYNATTSFAYQAIDNTYSKIYNNLKTESCKIIPIITINKANL